MKLNYILLISILFFSQCIKERLNPYDAGNPQAWSSTNLDVTKYRNGDEIPQVQNASLGYLTTGAWCYYEYNSANGAKYGKLYNEYAVTDPRGLAPAGYRIPSNQDWSELIDYLGEKKIAGTKMKSTTGWPEEGKGTNTSGLAGLPGAYRSFNGNFDGIGNLGLWWSSSKDNTIAAWVRLLNGATGDVTRISSVEQNGFSVRCLKD